MRGLFAVKSVDKRLVLEKREVHHINAERRVLALLRREGAAGRGCRFIAAMHGAYQTSRHVHFVLDYCPGGEIFHLLEAKRRFAREAAAFYAAEVLLALAHLHSLGVIYRDVKPENVVLDAAGHVLQSPRDVRRRAPEEPREQHEHVLERYDLGRVVALAAPPPRLRPAEGVRVSGRRADVGHQPGRREGGRGRGPARREASEPRVVQELGEHDHPAEGRGRRRGAQHVRQEGRQGVPGLALLQGRDGPA